MLIAVMKIISFNPGSLATGIRRALRTVRAARPSRWLERSAAAELHALGDYVLKDLGIDRSQIDQRVRFRARPATQSHGATEFI